MVERVSHPHMMPHRTHTRVSCSTIETRLVIADKPESLVQDKTKFLWNVNNNFART
jgi:hypothetical protein